GDDVEIPGGVEVLASTRDGDLVGAAYGEVNRVVPGGSVGRLDGRAKRDRAGCGHEDVGSAVDVEDCGHTALFKRFQARKAPVLAGACRAVPTAGPALEPAIQVLKHG